MEAPNIQLYNLFRYDLHLNDVKSLELMHILDKEFKSGVKEDLAVLSRQMNEGFQKIDARFTAQDERFIALDKKVDALDKKVDVKLSDLRGDLRAEIKDSKIDTNRYILSFIFAIILLFLAYFLRK